MSSGARLVARIVIRRQRATTFAAVSAISETRCSLLSRSKSSSRFSRYFSSVSSGSSPGFGSACTPARIVTAINAASVIEARSTIQAPSRSSLKRFAATSSASRVFPIPPAPTIVTTALRSSSAWTRAASSKRPMKLVLCRGRLFGGVCSARSALNSERRPSAIG